MEGIIVPKELVVGGMILAVVMWSAVSALSEPPTEREVLRLLPMGSSIADIPLSVDHRGGESGKRKALLPADRVTGHPDSLLVGYYSQPDPAIGPDAKGLPPAFYARAHVALIANTEKGVEVVWDSGGWGFQFGMERVGKPLTRKECRLLFDVRDLNGDGEKEVVFARLSYRAEGSRLEIWHFSEQQRRMLLLCRSPGRVAIHASGSRGWPRITAETFHAGTTSAISFTFSVDRGQYVTEHGQAE